MYADNVGRRTAAREQMTRYTGWTLDPTGRGIRTTIGGTTQPIPIAWNMSKSLVGTVISRVGGSQVPRVQFVTSDATWQTRRKGKKLDQFIDALFLAHCQSYDSVHDLCVAILRDACVWGDGVAIVSADERLGKVAFERAYPWEFCVDPRDSRYGAPSQMCRTHPATVRELVAIYPDLEEEIEAAPALTLQDMDSEVWTYTTSTMHHDARIVHDIWLSAEGPDDPGRHIRVLDDSTTLVDEEWEMDSPPLAWIHYDRPMVGLWSGALVDDIAPAEDELNLNLQRISRAIRCTSLNTILVQEGSVDLDKIASTTDAAVVTYTGQVPPQLEAAAVVNPSLVEWIKMQQAACHDLPGISEMAATAEKQPGLNSGVAIRAANGVQSLRYAWLYRQVECWHMQAARLAIAACRRLAEADVDFMASWPGAGFLRQIPWSSIDLDDSQYTMQMHPTGGGKNTPADRMQRAEELLGMGLITPDIYREITSGTQDIEWASDQASRQHELIERYIDQWLDATPEQIASGWIDEEKGQALLPAPIKWLDLPSAITQVAEAYIEAELDGAPDSSRQLMLEWLDLCDAEAKAQQARRAAAEAPPPGAVPPPGGPAPQSPAPTPGGPPGPPQQPPGGTPNG